MLLVWGKRIMLSTIRQLVRHHWYVNCNEPPVSQMDSIRYWGVSPSKVVIFLLSLVERKGDARKSASERLLRAVMTVPWGAYIAPEGSRRFLGNSEPRSEVCYGPVGNWTIGNRWFLRLPRLLLDQKGRWEGRFLFTNLANNLAMIIIINVEQHEDPGV